MVDSINHRSLTVTGKRISRLIHIVTMPTAYPMCYHCSIHGMSFVRQLDVQARTDLLLGYRLCRGGNGLYQMCISRIPGLIVIEDVTVDMATAA